MGKLPCKWKPRISHARNCSAFTVIILSCLDTVVTLKAISDSEVRVPYDFDRKYWRRGIVLFYII